MQNFAHKQNLWGTNEHILIAVSGGPDSMALLFFFLSLQKKYNFSLGVAHVNYNLRGNDSLKDARLVSSTCKKYNLPYYEYAPKIKNFSEESLRNIRYKFFTKICKENKFTRIALAHTKDDQVETFFLRLLRSSGPTGLSGMATKRGLFIRPFLETAKKDILLLLSQKNIQYRIDKTNKENLFLRNKIRNQLLPLLESYNPGIRFSLQKTITLLQEETRLLKECLDQKVLLKKSSKGYSFSSSRYSLLSPPAKQFFIRSLFLRNNLYPPKTFSLEKALKSLNDGLEVKIDDLRFTPKSARIHVHFVSSST